MPDDERTRRRLGDETKGRIADLASGWTVEPEASAPAAAVVPAAAAVAPAAAPPMAAAEPGRRKPKTLPPPPPGSEARKALEGVIVASAPSKQAAPPAAPAAPVGSGPTSIPAPVMPRPSGPTTPPRTKPPTAPPPARTAKPTAPPPIPPPRPKAPTSPVPVLAAPALTDYEDNLETLPEASLVSEDSKLTVPIGEFEDGSTLLEKDKLRIAHAQSTIKRDAASALLGIAEAPLTVVKEMPVEMLLTESAEYLQRGDPTALDSSTSKFERGDPTALGRTDATAASTPPAGMHTAAGRLRTVAALRRQRGIFGDVLYVRTALFGVRRSRHELAELEVTQATRQQERRRHLVILGRTAVTSDGFDHPALGPAREQLAGVEDERGRHRAQVGVADQELQRVTKDREAAAKQHVIDLASVDAELAELARRLEPLLKEQTVVTRRGAELRESLRRVEAKIAATTASMTSVKHQKEDPAAIQADLASLKAERVSVQRDEPKIASELDALNPRIAAIEAKRAESTRRRAELVQAEQDDQRRAEELLAAIGAKRKVMDRAAGDAETLRDKILFDLGERLYVDRPDDLGPQLGPIDSIDVELGTTDRRLMELREILSSIDRAKFARGLAVIVLIVAALGAATWWLLHMLG